MLFLVAAWTVLLAVAVPTGAAVLRWATPRASDRIASGLDRRGDRLIVCAWLGVLLLGSALLAASLVVPLSPAVGALVGIGAASAALSWRPAREEIKSFRMQIGGRLAVASLALAGAVGVATAQPVVWRDTGYYHASAIRWLSEHGAVEGIALVNETLGYGSSWFALAAPFNPGGLREQAMAVMGGFALLLLAAHALICLSRTLRRTARPADWMLIAGSAVLIPAVAALQKVHVSASPDLPIMVIGLLVGWAIFTLAGAPRAAISGTPQTSAGPAAVPLLLALGAMVVKPQAAPLAAVAALFYLWTGERRIRRAGWVGLLGIVFVAPWLGYEFVTTGCPAYPLPICADVPWSVGADAARHGTETVQSFARWRADPPPGSGLGWVGPWLTDDLSPALGALAAASVLALAAALLVRSQAPPASRRRGLAAWIAIAGATGLLLFFLRAEEIFLVTLACASLLWHGGGREPGTGWLLALGLAGVALVLYAAPDPRFAFGYMALLFGRLAIVHGPGTWARLQPDLDLPARLPRIGLAGLLAAAAAAVLVGTFARPTASRSEAFEPVTFALPPKVTAEVTVHPEFPLYRVPVDPDDNFCWAAELPCIPGYRVDPDVGLRDPPRGIGGGFTRSTDGG
jgi:hypothetical protein